MRSASTSRVSSADELSRVAQEKAQKGQPTLAARVEARPVAPETPKRFEAPRVVARPVMGQSPAASTTIGRDEAALILRGLTETLKLADGARQTGWRCTGVDDATFYRGRVLRDRLAAFLASPGTSGFSITKEETEVAEKILGCSNEATASSPNARAYVALGVILAAAAVFFSLTK